MQWNNGCVGVICGILLLVKGGEECGIVTGEGGRNFFGGGEEMTGQLSFGENIISDVLHLIEQCQSCSSNRVCVCF